MLFGNELIRVKKYALAKDETKKILVRYGSVQKLFTFRWTLFQNDMLVVFSDYDENVSQHMLAQDQHQHKAFRVMLKPKGAYEMQVPYMLVKFAKFDFAKNKAIFEIWLYDKRQEVYLKYLKQK